VGSLAFLVFLVFRKEHFVSSPNPGAVAAPAGGHTWAADAQPKLTVNKGLKLSVEYPIFPGPNYIGRADDKAVDIDLDDQEQPDRVWSSRQHACLNFENGVLTLEDLNSANGTFLNRAKIQPGQKYNLKPDDTIQIGTVQFKVKG
jgi:pSer/pThr/pTyr-binding forkhead associated (FHA) protein